MRKKDKKKIVPQRKKPPPNVIVSCGQHLDSSWSSMQETRFKKKYIELTKRLAQEVHFTFNEIESLLIIYEKFRLANGPHSLGMTTEQFADVIHNALDMTDIDITMYAVSRLHISYDPFASRSIFQMEAWIRALSLLLKGTFEEKIVHAFGTYDLMGSGIISKEFMTDMTEKNLVGEDNPEEAAKDMLEILIKKLDVDRDGKVNLNDYRECVTQEPLLMEVFGECLPSRYSSYEFLTTFTEYSGRL